METTGIIILAAGASKRLGTPKQQLTFQNKSLLLNAVHTASLSGSKHIVVVLGAFATQIKQAIASEKIHTIVNPNWPSGMGTSIQTGMQHLLKVAPDIHNVFLLVCDQPFVTPNLLQELHELKQSSGKRLAACSYGDTFGTPALFDKSYFPSLLGLTGQDGARKILRQNPEHTITLNFPQGGIDIDTNSDYELLIKQ
ncbi:nucleotidyltransferase family protein [Chitinophaga silvatica]|uniref:Nucleotidyltransferase family protein n=1 Tax=Chitinophaga silvatica TaxID=2282649 RepID=A0A3E1Y4Q2_9BACT|nr:nucleotidyltransferase family protein [Chitinophaga silvatica]RFS19690.1 nucleotidyltransferase family protein [Chitinophaga silvatica]